MQKQLSIIIPVYNVEKYICTCLESIFRQGLAEEDYELIIVDDGSTDKSMEVINDLTSQHNNVSIISQKHLGVALARNIGLAKAQGEYVCFIDSDDMLIDDALRKLLGKALESGADFILANFKSLRDEDIAKRPFFHINQEEIKQEENTGKYFFFKYNCPSPVIWRALYRLQFLQTNHIQFIPNIIYEDYPFTYKCYLKAKKCLKTNILLYIYRNRHSSITHSSITKRHILDYSTSIFKSWELRKTEGLTHEEYRKYQSYIFSMFHHLTKNLIFQNVKGFSDRIHSLDYLGALVPDLRFSNGSRERVISLLYNISPRLLMFLWIAWCNCRKIWR